MWFIDPPECLLCLTESRFSELRELGVNRASAYVNLGRYIMDKATLGRARAFIESFNELTRLTGLEDPHRQFKERLEAEASRIAEGLSRLLGGDVAKHLEAAALFNSVDVAMRGYRFSLEDLEKALSGEVRWIGISRGDVEGLVKGSRSVGYIVDNAGEFQIDLLSIRLLRRMGIEVTVYAKSKPYELDVTADYVRGHVEGLGVDVVGSGGMNSPLLGDAVKAMARHDLVIAKGLDNYETYLEFKPKTPPILFLFRAKCRLIANMLGVGFASPVAVLVK